MPLCKPHNIVKCDVFDVFSALPAALTVMVCPCESIARSAYEHQYRQYVHVRLRLQRAGQRVGMSTI